MLSSGVSWKCRKMDAGGPILSGPHEFSKERRESEI